MTRFFITTRLSIAAAVLLMLSACGTDDPYSGFSGDSSLPSTGTTTGSGGSAAAGSVDIEGEDLGFDYTFLSETETVPSDDNDYVENSTFSHQVYVAYSGTTATVTDGDGAVTTATSGADVTVTSSIAAVEYILSGTSTDGSFKIYSDKKFKLTLNGLTLTNPSGAAINCQSGKSMYLVIADGTTNTLCDGISYSVPDDEDMKGTIFSEGQILVSGSGTLNVTATGKNGIASDDYIVFRPGNVINITAEASNGVKANDSVSVRGGVLNIGVSTAGSKGINSEGTISVSGGRTTVITTGGTVIEDSDTKSCAGMKSDAATVISGGIVQLQSSGAGGKGLSSDATIDITGGEVTVVTKGKQYVSGSYDASPKGIKADGNLTISGGTVSVACSGGDGAEGIESKAVLTISGGEVVAKAYDDALNASTRITLSGGSVYALSSSNDAIDSNGTLYITGGTVVALGTTTPEGPFDCDNSTFAITGGTIIGLGGESSIPSTSATKQPVLLLGGHSYTSGQYVSLSDSSGTNIFSFLLPRSYTSSVLVVSSPNMSVGSTYTVTTGTTVSGGTSWQGLTTGATVSGGSSLASVKLSSYVTTSGTSSSSIGGGKRW